MTSPASHSSADPGDGDARAAAVVPPAKRGRTSLRPLVLRIHFYAGVFVAPLLVVACITGLLYAAMPQIESIVHRDVLHVDRPSGARPVALIDQVRAARASHPEGTVAGVRPAPAPDRTTRVILDVPGLPEGKQRTVFVDPYRGDVQGARTTLGEWLPVRVWFDDLHRHLHLGETGRLYSETAASWLWVIVLGGLYLLLRRRRDRRRRPAAKGSNAAGGIRPASARMRALRWHRIIGGVAAVGLLGLSATGLTWSKNAGENVADLRERLSWQTPSVDAGGGGGEHAQHGGGGAGAAAGGSGPHELQRLSAIDDAVRTAGGAGLRAPLVVTPPAQDGGRWQVREDRRRWPERQDAVATNLEFPRSHGRLISV
jgi:uncharacterized iron-regulated membrane protein